jgi:membrane-bound inhibitor of C-type lysozyme
LRPKRATPAATVRSSPHPPDTAKGGFALTFETGRELKLPQVLSADGGRYANSDIEFWIKGQSATLTMKGVKETCSAQ